MGVRNALFFVVGILILGTLGLSQDAFAEPLTLFPTFVDSFSVAGQETAPTGVAFSSDGAKMFVVGQAGDDVNQYTLTTPFDVSTASFVDSFPVFDQETAPRGVAFSSDGTKMFVVGLDGDAVNEYTLAGAFTLFHTTFVDSFSVSAQEIAPDRTEADPDDRMTFIGFRCAR